MGGILKSVTKQRWWVPSTLGAIRAAPIAHLTSTYNVIGQTASMICTIAPNCFFFVLIIQGLSHAWRIVY